MSDKFEQQMKRLKDLSIPVCREEKVICVGALWIRNELIKDFADLMEMNEKLEQT